MKWGQIRSGKRNKNDGREYVSNALHCYRQTNVHFYQRRLTLILVQLTASARGNIYRAAKCDAIANNLIVPNVFIDYCVSFCRATSISASNMQEPLLFVFF